MKYYYIYIATNYTNTTLYVGVTSDLEGRLWEHAHKINPNSFTARYNISKLVYCEEYTNIQDAISREKQIKGWRRDKKESLVNKSNPYWEDLLLKWNTGN